MSSNQTSTKKVVKHEELEEKVSRLFMAVSVLADAVEDGQWHGVRPHVRDILYPSWARPTYTNKKKLCKHCGAYTHHPKCPEFKKTTK